MATAMYWWRATVRRSWRQSLVLALLGGLLGAVALGAVAGTYGGYLARTKSVKALHVPDFVIALIEDAIAIGGGILISLQLAQ